MSNSSETVYQIALALIPQIGTKTARNLLAYTGSAEAVFKVNKTHLLKIPGIGTITADKLVTSKDEALRRAETELKFIEQHNVQAIFYTSPEYPNLLKQTDDAPIILYRKGTIRFQNRKTLSIVGTRKASPYGKNICEEIIKSLYDKGHNPIIISGLAYGIDICAHRAALKYGLDTVAVFGHGLERIYPATHRETAMQILNSGALITEFVSNARFERQNFLQRNRIIAGISEATLVVESGEKGGSLVTAEIANTYNREVFAIPGRIGDTSSAGCNYLIKKHKAYLAESADDIEYILGWDSTQLQKPVQQHLFIELSDNEKRIVNAIKSMDKPIIDGICKTAELTSAQVSALLLEMEFKGIIRNLPGKIFELTANFSE